MMLSNKRQYPKRGILIDIVLSLVRTQTALEKK